jgi:PelA/Pel-15E family pectate lyase
MNTMIRYMAAALTVTTLAWMPAPMSTAARQPRPWPPNQFLPVTQDRIAKLPAAEQPAWRAYLAASVTRAGGHVPDPAAEFSPLQPLSTPPRGGSYSRGLRLDAPAAWYRSDEARTIADHVVTWQTSAGAWFKGSDYSRVRTPGDTSSGDVWSLGTFDNDSTTTEMRFLVRVIAGGTEPQRSKSWRESFLRGLDYIFAAQYPNGGFPQVYPLVGGYHDAVTYNDDAMVHVIELLGDIAGGGDYTFVPAAQRQDAARRHARGIQCVLATQLFDTNRRQTVWCQQYDALTLLPAAARNFEPIADTAKESASIVLFLMRLPKPSAEVVTAVDRAVEWFNRAALSDVAWVREPTKSLGELTSTPGAPPLWARFYDPGTLTPIFGDRDRTIHYDVTEISAERRAGYAWYGTWPGATLDAYKTWRPTVGDKKPAR